MKSETARKMYEYPLIFIAFCFGISLLLGLFYFGVYVSFTEKNWVMLSIGISAIIFFGWWFYWMYKEEELEKTLK